MICCTKERGSPPTAPGSMDPMTKTDLAQYVDQIAADFGLGSPPGVSRGCCGVSTPARWIYAVMGCSTASRLVTFEVVVRLAQA